MFALNRTREKIQYRKSSESDLHDDDAEGTITSFGEGRWLFCFLFIRKVCAKRYLRESHLNNTYV